MEENITQTEKRSNSIPTKNEFFWVSIGQVLTIAGSLACVKVFTSLLSAEVYGEFALVLSGTLAYMYIFGVPLSSTAIRFYSIAKQQNNLDGLVSILLKKMLKIGLFSAILWIFYCAVSRLIILPLSVKYTSIIVLIALTTSAHTFFNGLQTGARNRAVVAGHSVVFEWMRLALGAGFLLFLGSTVFNLLTGIFLASLLICCSQLYFIKKRILPKGSTFFKKEISEFSKSVTMFYTPLVFSGIFVWGQRFADRWALKAWVSNEEIGNYFALYQLSLAPTLVASALFINLFSPLIFGQAGDAKNKDSLTSSVQNNGKTVLILILLSCAGFVLAYLLKDFIVNLLISDKYSVDSSFFPWLVLAGGIFAVSQQLLLSLQSHLKTKSIFVMSAVTIIIFSFLCFFGAKIYGVAGVVAAQLIYSLILFAWSASFHLRLTAKHKSSA